MSVAASTMSSYGQLIEALVDGRPWGFRNAGDIHLDQDQLGAVVADTDDVDVIEQVMRDDSLAHELRDQVNAAAKPDSLESALGAILLRYIDMYAQARVFNDVKYEVAKRDEAEAAAEEAADARGRAPEHGMRQADFA